MAIAANLGAARSPRLRAQAVREIATSLSAPERGVMRMRHGIDVKDDLTLDKERVQGERTGQWQCLVWHRGDSTGNDPTSPWESSIEIGQRLFGANCARCHGPDARGTAAAPELPDRVRGMSEDRFVDVVLRRYDWSMPAGEARSASAVREAMTQGLLLRRTEPGAMPPWQDEPTVRIGVRDLYRYLQSVSGRPAS